MDPREKLLRVYENALKGLPGGKKKNAEYRAYVRDSIREVFAASPHAGEAEVRELLGDPETVRESYIQSLSPEELALGAVERKKRRNRRLAVLLPVCALLLAFLGLFIRFHFFPPTTVAIGRPVNVNSEKYLERPMLVVTGGIFGESARSVLRGRVFTDTVSLIIQEMERKYPERRHIVCTVTVENGKTVVLWTGTGVTPDGVTEEVREQYVFPYRYRVQNADALSGQAAERARQAQEAARQAIEGTK